MTLNIEHFFALVNIKMLYVYAFVGVVILHKIMCYNLFVKHEKFKIITKLFILFFSPKPYFTYFREETR